MRKLSLSVLIWPGILAGVAIALAVVRHVVTLPNGQGAALERATHVALLIALMLALATVLEFLIRRALGRAGSPMARSGLVRGISGTIAYGLGSVMILSEFGVQIGPLLTALGVGGLAFALAFKDTAENMFSGINLLIDSSVEVGDRIRVESGQEGVVEDIGWRTSKINLGDEGMLIIPNAKLAQNITIRKKKSAAPRGNKQSSILRGV